MVTQNMDSCARPENSYCPVFVNHFLSGLYGLSRKSAGNYWSLSFLFDKHKLVAQLFPLLATHSAPLVSAVCQSDNVPFPP